MSVAILTDTNSGISVEEGKELGIYVIPMPVIVDDEMFQEGIDITHPQLYDAMKQNKTISSSQPSPGTVMDMWDSILKDGYDEVVYIPMSSGLSSSCATAIQLALDYEGRVFVADNHRISVPMRGCVLDAKHLAGRGFSGREIKEALERHAYDCSIYITVTSLDYLKKGGRITPAAAAIGTVLNIKPVLTIQGDKLDAFAKVRGIKHSEKKMIDAVRHDLETRFADIPAGQLQIATAGTFVEEQDAENWRKMVENAFPGYSVIYDTLSCSIACHTGMNAMAAGIFRIEER